MTYACSWASSSFSFYSFFVRSLSLKREKEKKTVLARAQIDFHDCHNVRLSIMKRLQDFQLNLWSKCIELIVKFSSFSDVHSLLYRCTNKFTKTYSQIFILYFQIDFYEFHNLCWKCIQFAYTSAQLLSNISAFSLVIENIA